ncbi:MAG: cbb3-type cytochrome c oxidase subunit I [Acidimicrobiia bacterium]
MAATATDIRSLMQANRTEPDSEAVAHVVTATIFLAVAAIGAAVGLISMTFPFFVPLGYGIIRAITMLAAYVGFGAVAVIGGAYFVLPRLTGAPLWNERLARLGLLLIVASVVVGMIVVGVGLGDGSEALALPWWIDLPLLVGLVIPALVAVNTVRHRSEGRSYVSVPYVVTALVALPLLYVVGNLPNLSSVAATVGDLFFSSSFLIAGVLLASIGLVYYAVVKQTDRPLAGRQLAQVGFWSLLFGAGWMGINQITSGPVPDWLAAVSSVLGLAFPAALVATAANLVATVSRRPEGEWDPVVTTAVSGTLLGVGVATLTAIAGFRSASTLLAYTTFWEAITYGLMLGVIPLLTASWMFHALPRMTGRKLFSTELARRHVRLTLWGAGGLILLLGLGGVVTGYSWAGGGFTGAFAAVGDGWAASTTTGKIFVGLGIIPGLVAVAGDLTLASLLFRTLTRGQVTTQEVLVTHLADEGPGDE